MSQELERVHKEKKETLWQAKQVQKRVNEVIDFMVEFYYQVGEFIRALEEAKSEQGTEKGS